MRGANSGRYLSPFPRLCSLWQLPPIVGNAPINAIIFATHGSITRELTRRKVELTSMHHFGAGALGGLAQCLVSSPMELVKIQMQASGMCGEEGGEGATGSILVRSCRVRAHISDLLPRLSVPCCARWIGEDKGVARWTA